MTNTLKLTAVSCLIMAFGSSVQAQESYVGIGAGAFNVGTGVSKKAVGGGYLQLGNDFSEFVGVEVRAGASGKTGEELTLQPRTGIDWFAAAYLKPRYQISEQLTGYALLGVATIRASYSEPGLIKQTKTRTGYAYGLGLQYRIAENYSLSGEWSHMLSKPKTNATAIKTQFKGLEASMFTLNGKYHF